jgi:hypothetical protein
MYIQLSDISWSSAIEDVEPSQSPLPSSTSSKSRWTRDGDQPPPISSTRALAAKLANTSISTSSENSKKRVRANKTDASTPTDNIIDADTIASRESGKKTKRARTNQTAPENSQNRTLRSSRNTTSKPETQTNSDEGNIYCLSPELTMIGGIPQVAHMQNTQSLGRVAKLPFSLF